MTTQKLCRGESRVKVFRSFSSRYQFRSDDMGPTECPDISRLKVTRIGLYNRCCCVCPSFCVSNKSTSCWGSDGGVDYPRPRVIAKFCQLRKSSRREAMHSNYMLGPSSARINNQSPTRGRYWIWFCTITSGVFVYWSFSGCVFGAVDSQFPDPIPPVAAFRCQTRECCPRHQRSPPPQPEFLH